MKIAFTNDHTKTWLARKGPAKVFGKDVDKREALSEADAIKWFDDLWEATLCRAVSGRLFICQLPDLTTCDQLWFIPSTSGDPRTLYVKFKTVPIKEDFDKLAGKLNWKPEELAEKILLDFMESVTRKSYRGNNA